MLQKSDFLIRLRRQAGKEWAFLNNTEAEFFFNRARCQCKEPVQIVVEMSTAGLAKRSLISTGKVELLLGGKNCLASNPTDRERSRCTPLSPPIKLAELAVGQQVISKTVEELFREEKDKPVDCNTELTHWLWLWVNANTKSEPDLYTDAAPSLQLQVDGQPPPAPRDVAVTGGNEALGVRWGAIERTADFGGYVVLCARGG